MSARPAALGDLARLSAELGGNVDLVQGGGGNSSVKADGALWIKASGTWLAEAETRDIFLPVDLARLAANIAADAEEPTRGTHDDGAGFRPSIETTLHALMRSAVVLHTHSVNAIAWACRADGAEAAGPRLAGLDWLWVPYARPGLPLTRAVRRELETRPDARVLVLRNHGLVIAADTVAEVRALNAEVERRLAIEPRPSPAGEIPSLEGWRAPADPLVHAIATDPSALALARRGPLYPDHVVFLDGAAPIVEAGAEAGEAIDRHERAWGRRPAYLVFAGTGVAVADEITRGAEEMLRCLARVALRIAPEWSVAALGTEDVRALVEWEAEHFRRALDRPGAT